jgi:AraC-like DNA-binding protein
LNFKDAAYFNRFFKKHTGTTPTAYQAKKWWYPFLYGYAIRILLESLPNRIIPNKRLGKRFNPVFLFPQLKLNYRQIFWSLKI